MAGKAKWTKSLRLNFSYSNDSIELISTKSIEIIPPPTDTLHEKSGFSVNLADGTGDIFYSRMIRNPLSTEGESSGESGDEPITMETLDKPDTEFSVLVPDPGKVFTVEIVNLPYVEEQGVTSVRGTFRFTIDPAQEIAPAAIALEGLEDGRV